MDPLTFISDGFEDRYEYLDTKPFAKGGQAEIFRVHDRRLKRIVALKRITACGLTADEVRMRFFSEAQITGQLQHPGFLPILDCGLDPLGRPYFTTYLLSGRTFADLIREVHAGGPPAVLVLRRALEVFETIGQIVAYAHSRGVFHRDLKPNNVLLGGFGEVFVIDMGAALVVPGPESAVDPAVPGMVRTDRTESPESGETEPRRGGDSGRPWHPLYSPPELVRGELVPDERTCDVYALGVMLYELAAGVPPYSGPDGFRPPRRELESLIRAGPPAPLRHLAPRTPRDLAAICARAMHPDPTRRYTEVGMLAGDVRAFLETRVVSANDPGPLDRMQKWVTRKSRSLAIAAVVLAALGITGASAWTYKVRNESARQLNHLRAAQLASRNGDWPMVLANLDAAERAGYGNRIELGLQRYAAHIALADARAAREVLDDLERLPDPGPQRGAILLRRAELELFSPATAAAAAGKVRDAISLGLSAADQFFARGLLAETSPEALEFLRQALERDPYHHGAHRHSLGLEFMLARNDRLRSHISIMRVLYPHDPSASFIHAARMALDGHAAEATALAATLHRQAPGELTAAFDPGLRMMSQAAEFFEPDAFLRGDPGRAAVTNRFLADALGYFMRAQPAPGLTNPSDDLRLPQLPCVKEGLSRGMKALFTLMIGPVDRMDAALPELRKALSIHPESLLALTAATMRASRRPPEALSDREFLRVQVELFQQAAELPSVVTTVPALARLLATLHQRDLASRLGDPDPAARAACRSNLNWFITHPEPGPNVNRTLCSVAREVDDPDLARIFLRRWEASAPDDPETARSRIRLELDAGSWARALELVRDHLSHHPEDPAVIELRNQAEAGIRRRTQPELPRQDQPSGDPPGAPGR